MPYRRKTRYRRRRPKKPMRYKIADTAYKAYKGVKYLKGLVNAELHHWETDVSNAQPSTTGIVKHLSDLTIGDLATNRTGNSILAKYLFGRIQFSKNTAAPITFIRCMIVKDNQQIGDTSPLISNILSSVSTYSPLNPNTAGRFKIMKDFTIKLEATKTASQIKINMKLPFHIKFNGSTGVDIQKNGLYFVMLSNEPINFPSVYYNLKLSFYDN